jgi:rare lipoprotein A
MKRLSIFLSLFIISVFSSFAFEEEGVASWYGPSFHGKKTANGEIFNTYSMTAAHKTLPFGSIVKVISLDNEKEIIVRINDRGPFKNDRIIDLSKAAAASLGVIKTGTMNVRIVLLEEGENVYHKYKPQNYHIQIASFTNEESANNLSDKLKEKGFDTDIQTKEFSRTFYRVIIDNINYSELQLYRLKLHQEGITNFLIVRK